MTKNRLLLLPLLLAAVAALAAGCGGGGSSSSNVPADAIASVGSTNIPKSEYNLVLAAAKGTAEKRGQTFPKVGTSQYAEVRDQIVTYLVDQVELAQGGKQIGVTITSKDVQTRLTQLKKQYFKGSEKKWKAALRASGETLPQVLLQLRGQVLGQKVYNKVTAGITVTAAQAKAYYEKNKATYTTKASRHVRHILVATKAKAETIEADLRHGQSFATLAKKYSTDTTSAKKGGDLGVITQGETVPTFDKAAFSLKTDQISQPVHSPYGWHIIEPLGPITPAKVTPYSKVATQIRTTLLSKRKQSVMTAWSNKLKKQFKGKIHYQAGYEPTTTSTSTTTPATTATTG
ncbi:MAG TPA: peptidylprolyl isomerase [Gaiellaceae bacterium]|nr:peptidylprolyl isomerase [Gaiellaceae bacterium]